MLKLFIYKRIENQADSKLLRLFLSEEEYEGKIFQKIPTAPFKNMVQFVDAVDECDYILLAHEYYFVKQEDVYLKRLDKFAKDTDKKIIVFDYGDIVDKVKLENSLILRTAGYRSTLKQNEIIVPPFIEDLGATYGHERIKQKNEKPVVGFVGMVKLPSWWQEIKFQIRTNLDLLLSTLSVKNPASLQGLLFRRKVIKLLKKSKTCITNFIIRNSFSAHEKTISDDPAIIRKEYIDAIKSSDLNLIVRGDGNYSLRFFEVLSLGRVPLFIDTEAPLPLESEIAYDSFMLRIDYRKMDSISSKIESFWSELGEDDYQKLQSEAREVFETKLRPDVFYKNLFDKLATEARK